MTRLLIVVAVAFVLVAAAFVWMWRTYLPGASLADIYFGMTPVLLLVACAIVVATSFGVVSGLQRRLGRVRTTSMTLLAFGGLGAGYGELETRFGMLIDNVVNFATRAPGRTDSLAILALALFGALVTLSVPHLKAGVRQV